MVHKIKDNHMKISSHSRIRGSVRDATPQELHTVVKQEHKLAKNKKRGYRQENLFSLHKAKNKPYQN